MNNLTNNFGEIVESSHLSWRVQCWHWNKPPQFGSLITLTTGSKKLFGIITDLHTGSSDPTRTVHAYQKTEQELKKELPHIFSFLQTLCTALPIGYQDAHSVPHYHTPLTPPKLHSFTALAQKEDYMTLFSSAQYLAPLINNTTLDQGTREEVLLALLVHQKTHELLDEKFLERFIHAYTYYVNHDYAKIRMFLQRVQPLIDSL